MAGKLIYVVGTFDTKAAELGYLADQIASAGVAVQTVDVSATGAVSTADVPAQEVAACHPGGAKAVFTGDRGIAVAAMIEAFKAWVQNRNGHIGGMISAGGSGGTALVTPAMQILPVGTPKVMVSTVASGDVQAYVGPSDIMMMYSVTDVQGLNAISRRVLGNAAAAIAGMLRFEPEIRDDGDKPGIGLTMFGVTTAAVQKIAETLESEYEPYVFHATGVGGRSMEKLADGGFFKAVIDLTTTEICDLLYGGVFPATEDRFGAIIRTGVPYVGSVGALDMVNFAGLSSVPPRNQGRQFYEHNPQVTLMRTTPEENAEMGRWIGERLNQMVGPVRFLLPEGGISALDAPGKPFEDATARKALFDAIKITVTENKDRQLITVPHHINDPEFAEAAVQALGEVSK